MEVYVNVQADFKNIGQEIFLPHYFIPFYGNENLLLSAVPGKNNFGRKWPHHAG